ncbi:MAG: hypothetical protein MR550_05650 [Bacilli bacterium]|nr:hypothetical protein [Bacilli bacterium]
MSILNRDFKILDKTLLFIDNLDNLISNVPRREYYYKDKIIDNSYKLLEYIMRANNVDSISVKQECLTEIIVYISLLNSYLNRFYFKKYISEKQLFKSINLLNEIHLMVNSWLSLKN